MQGSEPPTNSISAGSQPPEPIESLVPRAERIVVGTIDQASTGDFEVLVSAVLSGTASVGERIAVVNAPDGARMVELHEGEAGVWVLADGDPAPVLAGGVGGPSCRTVERVMAGLPAVESPPDDLAIKDLAAQSDVVVWAEVTSTDGITASATRLKVLKGEIPKTFTVTAAGPSDVVGGPWQFPVQDVPDRPVLFLKASGDTWLAINPTDVSLYRPSLVERALAYQPTP